MESSQYGSCAFHIEYEDHAPTVWPLAMHRPLSAEAWWRVPSPPPQKHNQTEAALSLPEQLNTKRRRGDTISTDSLVPLTRYYSEKSRGAERCTLDGNNAGRSCNERSKVHCRDCCGGPRLRTDEQFAGQLQGPSEHPEIEMDAALGIMMTYQASAMQQRTKLSYTAILVTSGQTLLS